jgi:hypothetical protein
MYARTHIAAFVIPLFILCFAAPALARDAFVGTWKVEVQPDEDAVRAKAKEFKDELTFKGMKLESKELKKQGFEPTTYTEDTRGGIVATFKCTAKNKAGDSVEWTGTSTGVDITGELTWTKKDGTAQKYTFKGTKNQ